ncbi:MAG: OB-fold nucleic acid binding domain-containing protein, partial [Myxococcota bacterium]
MARFIDELKRTHSCGELREAHIGEEVVLFGWVQSYRDHGGCIFIDLRDRDGLTQIVFDPKEDFPVADRARSEWCLGIRGTVRGRGQKDDGTSLANPRLATGAIEVLGAEIHVFNEAKTPPFQIQDDVETGEEKRLEHRYLDLRRP